MPEASTLQFLFQLAKGIASQFGPNCEVVVHTKKIRFPFLDN